MKEGPLSSPSTSIDPMPNINYFSEDVDFSLQHEEKISQWLEDIAASHEYQVETINYIFCSDDYLLDINKTYLEHDYYTDIITFDNSSTHHLIESDIFISIDRVTDNTKEMGIPFEEELHRVLVHGLLHLVGFDDKGDDHKILMRQKEDACLSLLKI